MNPTAPSPSPSPSSLAAAALGVVGGLGGGGGGAGGAGRPRYHVELRLLRLTETPYALRRIFARWKAANVARMPPRADTPAALVASNTADWTAADPFAFEVVFQQAHPAAAGGGGGGGGGGPTTAVTTAPAGPNANAGGGGPNAGGGGANAGGGGGGANAGLGGTGWEHVGAGGVGGGNGNGGAGDETTTTATYAVDIAPNELCIEIFLDKTGDIKSAEEIGVVKLDLAELADELEHAEKHLLQGARMNAMLELVVTLKHVGGHRAIPRPRTRGFWGPLHRAVTSASDQVSMAGTTTSMAVATPTSKLSLDPDDDQVSLPWLPSLHTTLRDMPSIREPWRVRQWGHDLGLPMTEVEAAATAMAAALVTPSDAADASPPRSPSPSAQQQPVGGDDEPTTPGAVESPPPSPTSRQPRHARRAMNVERLKLHGAITHGLVHEPSLSLDTSAPLLTPQLTSSMDASLHASLS